MRQIQRSLRLTSGAYLMDGEQPKIKIESDSVAGSPSAHTGDEFYEDAGGLDFEGSTQGLNLTRIPKFFWETRSKIMRRYFA